MNAVVGVSAAGASRHWRKNGLKLQLVRGFKIEPLSAQRPPDTRAEVLEMHRLMLLDTSGLARLQQLHRTLKRQDIGLVLAHVNEQPLSLIRRSGFAAVLGEEAIVPTVAGAFDAAPTPRA